MNFIKFYNHCNVFLSSCQWTLHCQQFSAMFIKRAMFYWRNWKIMLLQILGLLGIVYLLMKGVQIIIKGAEPGREMDLDQYGQTIVPFSTSGNNDFTQNLTKNLEILLRAKKQKLHKVKGKSLFFYFLNDFYFFHHSWIEHYSVLSVSYCTAK